MRYFIQTLKYFSIFLVGCFLLFIGFILWNHYPPLPLISKPTITIFPSLKANESPHNPLKIATYNIQFGSGIENIRREKNDKKSFKIRLDALVEVLKKIDADILFLQEVDFSSARSHNIDQAEYLARKAKYPYLAKAPHWKRRLLPHITGLSGPLNHGLCILSKFPLIDNEAWVFDHPEEAPFYVRWLYSPHGGQRATVVLGEKKIVLMNLHLEPWAQKTREKSVRKITRWIQKLKKPLIIGGDFNALPPESAHKSSFHLQDAPWFIDRSQWNLEKDQTVQMFRNLLGFTEAFPAKQYLKDERKAFTFPSYSPIQKLDYLFAGNGASIVKGSVFKKAGLASDHFPIIAEVAFQAPNIPPITPKATSQKPTSMR